MKIITDFRKSPARHRTNALIHATVFGSMEDIQYCLDVGVDVDGVNEAINYASLHGKLDKVKYLFERGVDISLKSFQGIKWATYHNHTEIIQFFLDHGVKRN